MLSHRELENFFFFFFQEKLKALIDFLIPFFFFSPKIKSTIQRSTSNWNDFVAFIASRATIRVLGESYPSFTAIWYMWYIPHRFKSPQRSRLHNDRVKNSDVRKPWSNWGNQRNNLSSRLPCSKNSVDLFDLKKGKKKGRKGKNLSFNESDYLSLPRCNKF